MFKFELCTQLFSKASSVGSQGKARQGRLPLRAKETDAAGGVMRCAARRLAAPSKAVVRRLLLRRATAAAASSSGPRRPPQLTQRQARRASSSFASSSSSSSSILGEQYVLGIETSCDDTAAAVVSGRTGEVVSESILSSVDLQAKLGGVVPALAQQAHVDAIDGVVGEALERAGLRPRDLSAVAVTIGPGLSLCLKVGVLKAREVAHEGNVPLIPVHHMEAHALVARLVARDRAAHHQSSLDFPFLALLVSGGHNLLVLVEGLGRYKILGTTLDDAVGEAYDKVARLLGLDLSSGGGPAVEALARLGDPAAFDFPVPLRKSRDKGKNCDFSFAGLKTSVRTAIDRGIGLDAAATEANLATRADIAASFQRVAVLHLCLRTRTAIQWARESHPGLGDLVVAGGVAANETLRAELEALAGEEGVNLIRPPPKYCTDNGVMVAWTGLERLRSGVGVGPVPESAKPAEGEWVELRPRWPLGDLDERCSQQRQKIKSAKTRGIKMSLTQETALLAAAKKARLQRT